jgi:hypothetical protein
LQRDEAADDRGARIRVEHAEGQVLQLLAHPLHAHPARKRRVDVHRLMRFLRLLFGRHVADRAHVVQPVGELDEDHAQILGHRHEQLAEVFGLLGLAADSSRLVSFVTPSTSSATSVPNSSAISE